MLIARLKKIPQLVTSQPPCFVVQILVQIGYKHVTA
jgi:hypothetical protein